jgi:hypothetical protein
MQVKLGAGLALVAALLTAGPLVAQTADDSTRTAARALGTAGVEAYQANDFVLATDKLEKAYGILRVPSLGLWSGRALVKNGKLVEAADRFLETTSLQVPTGEYAVQKQAQTDAASELQALRPRIPVLRVTVEGASLAECTVTIDGQSVSSSLVAEGRLVNPGSHVVEAHRGSDVARTEVTAVESGRTVAALKFAPPSAGAPPAAGGAPPPTAPPPVAPAGDTGVSQGSSAQKTWGWVALGVGGAGLAVGGVAGIVSLTKKGQLDRNDHCVGGTRCATSETDLVDSYNTSNTVASVGFIAGGALAGLGIVLLLTAPTEAGTQAFIGPTSAGVRGRF